MSACQYIFEQNKNRPVLPGGLSFHKPGCYSPFPKRRDHHPARRGWVSVVVSEAGWAGAGAADG
jgi:hypothetical protein